MELCAVSHLPYLELLVLQISIIVVITNISHPEQAIKLPMSQKNFTFTKSIAKFRDHERKKELGKPLAPWEGSRANLSSPLMSSYMYICNLYAPLAPWEGSKANICNLYVCIFLYLITCKDIY